MPITSKQETILAYIVATLLPTINGAGDFNFDIGKIARGKYAWDKFGDFPVVMVIDESGSALTELSSGGVRTTGNTFGSIEDGWNIWLLGYVKAETDPSGLGNVGTDINKLYSDITVALYADRDLGGNCLSANIVNFEKEENIGDGNIGALLMTVAIKYDFTPAATTPVT